MRLAEFSANLMCSDSECPALRLDRYRRFAPCTCSVPAPSQLRLLRPGASKQQPGLLLAALPFVCGLPLPSSAVLLAAVAVALAHARKAINGNNGRLRCSALGRSLLRRSRITKHEVSLKLEREEGAAAVSPDLATSSADLAPCSDSTRSIPARCA